MAAVFLVSCQKATDSAQGSAAGPAGQAIAPAAGSETEVPANTVLWVRLTKDLDSSKLRDGSRFHGEIAEDVLMDGKAAIPKGTGVNGRVTNSQTAQSQGSAGFLTVVLDSFMVKGSTYQITTNSVTLEGHTLEQTLPKDKASAIATDVKNAFVPKNGVIQFLLAQAVRIKN